MISAKNPFGLSSRVAAYRSLRSTNGPERPSFSSTAPSRRCAVMVSPMRTGRRNSHSSPPNMLRETPRRTLGPRSSHRPSWPGSGARAPAGESTVRRKSAAVFSEFYWQIQDALKLTAGLRYTDDKKIFTPVPSQVLLAWSAVAFR